MNALQRLGLASSLLALLAACQRAPTAAPAADATAAADATLTLTRPIFVKMMAGTAGVRDTLLSDELKVDGSRIDLVRFFTLIDKAAGSFPIVTR